MQEKYFPHKYVRMPKMGAMVEIGLKSLIDKFTLGGQHISSLIFVSLTFYLAIEILKQTQPLSFAVSLNLVSRFSVDG